MCRRRATLVVLLAAVLGLSTSPLAAQEGDPSGGQRSRARQPVVGQGPASYSVPEGPRVASGQGQSRAVMRATAHVQPNRSNGQAPLTPPPPPPEADVVNERIGALEQELAALRQQMQRGGRLGLYQGENDASQFQPFEDRLAKVEQQLAGPKYPIIKVSGFFQLDSGWFSQDQNSVATFGQQQNGTDFRRTRLMALGSVAENINYMIEMDFAFPGRPSFMDVWAEVSQLPILGTVRAGQYRTPFSLDALDSVRQLTFLERASMFALYPFRRTGVMAYNHNEAETATWAYSVTRAGADQFGGDIGNSGGYEFTGRMTLLPYYDGPSGGRYFVHLGAGYNYSQPGTNTYRFNFVPEFFVGAQPASPTRGTSNIGLPGVLNGTNQFVDTGTLAVQDFSLYGVEFAGSWGSFHWQSEAMTAVVNQIGNPVVTLPAAYAQLGYFLTGEHRPYIKNAGTFGSIKPLENFFRAGRPGSVCTGRGAWEVAGRWSWIDLNDKNVHGNQMTNFTAGLNWYLHEHAKLQFNYIYSMVDNFVHGDANTNIFALRAQADF